MSTEGRAADRAIVGLEMAALTASGPSRRALALLVALRERAEGIRRTEMEKARRRMGVLTPAQERAIEAATTAIVNKLLHTPAVRLKEMARSGHSDEQATLVRRVLGLA